MSDDAAATQPVEPFPTAENLRLVVQPIVKSIVEELEQRMREEQLGFEQRIQHRVTTFMDEMRDHIARLSEESTVGHSEMIESNNNAVSELRSLRVHVDAIVAQGTRDRNQFDRNASAVQTRMQLTESVLSELKTATRALTLEIRTSKRQRQAMERRQVTARRRSKR